MISQRLGGISVACLTIQQLMGFIEIVNEQTEGEELDWAQTTGDLTSLAEIMARRHNRITEKQLEEGLATTTSTRRP